MHEGVLEDAVGGNIAVQYYVRLPYLFSPFVAVGQACAYASSPSQTGVERGVVQSRHSRNCVCRVSESIAGKLKDAVNNEQAEEVWVILLCM
jgi:hypothetical protein